MLVHMTGCLVSVELGTQAGRMADRMMLFLFSIFMCLRIGCGEAVEPVCDLEPLQEEVHKIGQDNKQLKHHLADLVQDVRILLDREERDQAPNNDMDNPHWFKHCQFPSNGILANGQVIPSTDEYGQRVLLFQCSEGFSLVGNNHLKCHLGTWKGVVPRCAAKDCLAHYDSGLREDGVYGIQPDGRHQSWVYCDMKNHDGGWTVFQRRTDGNTDFYRDYRQYQQGFGDLQASYWLGLDILHALTRQESELYVDMVANDTHRASANYSIFMVAGMEDDYRLTVSGYTGSAGDSLGGHSGMPFSTYDSDMDKATFSCSKTYHGAWWYAKCHSSNLNGRYLDGLHPDKHAQGVNWKTYTGYYYSLKTVVMKVRRKKTA